MSHGSRYYEFAKQLQVPSTALKQFREEFSVVAKKNRMEAAGSDKIRKTKTGGRSTQAKRPTRPKKMAIEKAEAKPASVPVTAFDPTDEQIQTRAYFISERRRRFDLPGDANTDWLEAKRQLLAETRH
jgi:Protein of unknown function (DUF2934)